MQPTPPTPKNLNFTHNIPKTCPNLINQLKTPCLHQIWPKKNLSTRLKTDYVVLKLPLMGSLNTDSRSDKNSSQCTHPLHIRHTFQRQNVQSSKAKWHKPIQWSSPAVNVATRVMLSKNCKVKSFTPASIGRNSCHATAISKKSWIQKWDVAVKYERFFFL